MALNIPIHFDCIKESEDYKKCCNHFDKNKILELSMVVENPIMTTFLFNWLYRKMTIFGCKLMNINFK